MAMAQLLQTCSSLALTSLCVNNTAILCTKVQFSSFHSRAARLRKSRFFPASEHFSPLQRTPRRSCVGGPFSTKIVQRAQTALRWRFSPDVRFQQVRAPRLHSTVRAQMDEAAAAEVAASTKDTGAKTIFDKIISKEIPSTVVYEDDKVLGFRDINPQAPVHIILIPKYRDGLTQLSKATEGNKEVLGHLLYTAKVVAEQEGLEDGFRVVINDGPNGCQSVYHLHLHIIGGRKLKWPPG